MLWFLILAQLPLASGSVVETRPLGLVKRADILLPVPVTEPAFAALSHPVELPTDHGYELMR